METIININEIKAFFDENAASFDLKSTHFDAFLQHLEIDFFEWLKDSIKSFEQ